MSSRRKRLVGACSFAAALICFPCVLCLCLAEIFCGCLGHHCGCHHDAGVRGGNDVGVRLERGREARRVRPLGPVRERKLSQTAMVRQNEQTGSPLFSRLPAEIRTVIWQYVLGGQRYHLMQVPKRVGHHRCLAGTSSDPGRSCCLPAMSYWRHEVGTISYRDYLNRHPEAPLPHAASVEMLSPPPDSDSYTLALLRTCQRVYRESINNPYYSNIFDIDDPETLLKLRQTIPRQRLRAIKHLGVYVETQYPPLAGMHTAPWYGSGDGVWTLMWHTIAHDMAGLEALELIIQSGSLFPAWGGDNPRWCGMLRDVKGLKSFQLTVKEGQQTYSEESDEHIKVLTQSLRECMCQPRSTGPSIQG